MTKAGLDSSLLRIVEIVEQLGFGIIENLLVHRGLPCLAPEPRLIQAIKLDSSRERRERLSMHSTLPQPFERLVRELKSLDHGHVSIEVHYGLPFRLTITHRDIESLK